MVEGRALDAARARVKNQADRLLGVALKADALRRLESKNPNVIEQQQVLDAHLERVTDMVADQFLADYTEVASGPAIDLGIDAGGLAADLMRLDRLTEIGKLPTRSMVNRGLAWTWELIRGLEADPNYATANRRAAELAQMSAEHWRDKAADKIPQTAALRAGATAAQIMDVAISVPRLLATGSSVLKALAEWISRGGGGGGSFSLLTAGGGTTLLVTSGGRSLVLTPEQIEALVAAGIVSVETSSIYSMAMASGSGGSGGGAAPGPLRQRGPGSKSRYDDEELVNDYKKSLQDIEKSLPPSARANAEGLRLKLRHLYENHHLLVRQLRRWFEKAGLNIEDYVVRMTADEHRWIHNEYRWNELWAAFKRKNPGASSDDILTHMVKLQKKLGLEGLELVPPPR